MEERPNPKQLAKEVGERIREARLDNGFRQEDLAKLVGKSPRTINYWENGDLEEPPYRALRELEKALNRSKEWLLGTVDARSHSGDGRAPGDGVIRDAILGDLPARLERIEAQLEKIESHLH